MFSSDLIELNTNIIIISQKLLITNPWFETVNASIDT